MSIALARQILSIALLGTGVGVVLICCVGMLAADDAFDRLHFVTPTSTIGIGFVSLAIIINKPLGNTTLKIAFLFVVTVVTSPILSHATARAARMRRFAEWRIYPEELADDHERERRTGHDEEARRIREQQASLSAQDVSPTLVGDGDRDRDPDGDRRTPDGRSPQEAPSRPDRRPDRRPDKDAVVWRLLSHRPGRGRSAGREEKTTGEGEQREVVDPRLTSAGSDEPGEYAPGEHAPGADASGSDVPGEDTSGEERP